MLCLKNTTLFSEIGSFFKENDSSDAIFTLLRILRSFNLPLHVLNLRDRPNARISRSQTLMLLIMFPCFMVKNVFGYSCSPLSSLISRQKDSFYRLLSDGSIEWRKILYCFNSQMLRSISVRSDSRHNPSPVCLIVDDTDFPKTGKMAERLGYIYSHTRKRHILGYKGLFLLRTDGKTQMALDCSLHGEMGKNAERPYGVKPSQRKRQFSTSRGEKENAVKERISEYDRSKISVAIEMVSRAARHHIHYDYLLADSWFTCKEIIGYIKTRMLKCHYLGMIKMGNARYEYNGAELTSTEIIRQLHRRRKTGWSKKMKLFHAECDVKLAGMEVRLLFYRKTKRGKWVALMTTDRSLNFMRAVKVYSMRWSIEVFFKESKGLLGLGKSQTRNFASQIAEMAVTALQFNILSTAKRFADYETLGGLFKNIKSDTVKLTVTERIWELVTKILCKISDLYDINLKDIIDNLIDAEINLGRVEHIILMT
jgi:hypothetical protein